MTSAPNRRRIAIVAESFLPDMNGVTNSVLRITEQLRARGHDCAVIAPGPGASHVDGVPVIRVRSCDLPRGGDMRIGLPTARLTRLLRRIDPDVVHLAAPAVLGAAGARAARNLGLPCVAVYQTDLAGFARRRHLGFASRAIWRWIRHVHSLADVNLAPSTAAAWALRDQRVPSVRVWGRGVDLDRFHPARRSEELRGLLAPGGHRLVGYVGRLAGEKQVHRLAALEHLSDTQVVVVGDGPAAPVLRRLLPGSVFLGARDGEALATVFASLDVFVHTGLDETFCQTIQEALASGVPVVAPAAGGPLDLVRHGVNGYLWHPSDAASFPRAVRALVESEGMRAHLAAAARDSVVARPWSALVDELLDHYDAAANTRGVKVAA